MNGDCMAASERAAQKGESGRERWSCCRAEKRGGEDSLIYLRVRDGWDGLSMSARYQKLVALSRSREARWKARTLNFEPANFFAPIGRMSTHHPTRPGNRWKLWYSSSIEIHLSRSSIDHGSICHGMGGYFVKYRLISIYVRLLFVFWDIERWLFFIDINENDLRIDLVVIPLLKKKNDRDRGNWFWLIG